MAHISGFERSQILLLPEAVDDYVGADNPVRFIDAFVDELDLAAAGFVRAGAKATGRPGYAQILLGPYCLLNEGASSSNKFSAEGILRGRSDVHSQACDRLRTLCVCERRAGQGTIPDARGRRRGDLHFLSEQVPSSEQ
jgi:hypothetical protein